MDDITFFWNGWEAIIRILVVGILCYVSLVVILKVSGKRTLASLTAFDFIITVAIGAVYGRLLTAKDVSMSEAVTAFILLAVLQFVFSWLQMKYEVFKKLFTSHPILLYYRGEFLEKAMKKEGVEKSELIGEARKKGYGNFEDIELIILENDATFSIIGKLSEGDGATYNEFLDKS